MTLPEDEPRSNECGKNVSDVGRLGEAGEGAEPARSCQSGLFQARDGTSIFYEVQGKGKPLLFCYGLVCRREHWHHQVDHFVDRYQIISFDYRGHHRSSAPRNDQHITVEWFARDVQDLIHHLGLQEVVCLGHSLGVAVAALAAELEPKVKAGVLICGTVTNPFDHMFYTDRMNRLYRLSAYAYDFSPSLTSLIWDFFTKKDSRLGFLLTAQLGFNPDSASERDILSYMEGVNQTPFGVFQALLKDYTQYDGRPGLKRVQVPVLVIGGEDDLITPPFLMEEIAGLIPQGELKLVAEGSHNAHSDFPQEVNAFIQEFLTRINY